MGSGPCQNDPRGGKIHISALPGTASSEAGTQQQVVPVMETRIIQSRYPDSIELGRVGHGGVVKIYFDADNLEQAEKRIDNALAARDYLIKKLAERGST